MTLKFHQRDFETHEFNKIPGITNITSVPAYKARDIAQQIFDAWIKENGKVLYFLDTTAASKGYDAKQYEWHTHKALLINVEPIEKCKHPKEKVTNKMFVPHGWDSEVDPWTEVHQWHQCECGAKVQPKEFEEC